MIEDIRSSLEKYAAWVRDKTQLRDVGNDYVEITTPYLDRHNDYLQIYRSKGRWVIPYHIWWIHIQDLRSSGCELDNKRSGKTY